VSAVTAPVVLSPEALAFVERLQRELGRRLREQVAAHHSADSWAEGILAAARRA